MFDLVSKEKINKYINNIINNDIIVELFRYLFIN